MHTAVQHPSDLCIKSHQQRVNRPDLLRFMAISPPTPTYTRVSSGYGGRTRADDPIESIVRQRNRLLFLQWQ